jgi:hypothetical protein
LDLAHPDPKTLEPDLSSFLIFEYIMMVPRASIFANGLISPWALPTIGISLSVAESLERALKELWHRQVVEFAEEYGERTRRRIQSAIMTPPDLEPDYSFSFEAEDLGALLSEWEKSLE